METGCAIRAFRFHLTCALSVVGIAFRSVWCRRHGELGPDSQSMDSNSRRVGWLNRLIVDGDSVPNAPNFSSTTARHPWRPIVMIDQVHYLSSQLIRTPGFGVALTIFSYMLGISIQKACRGASVVNPVLIAMLVVAGLLNITGISYQAYDESAQLITFLLGPATVALAVPLIKNVRHLGGRIFSIFLALTAGSLVSALSGIGLVAICGGSRAVAFSMAPKAVTTPIAINIAQTTGGIPSLSAVFAIGGGIVVAMSIKWLLDWTRITDTRVFGFAAGTAGSGIGAAHALSFSELAGAFAALAVGFNGLLTPLIVPALEHFWPK